jgi:hypothetical protein
MSAQLFAALHSQPRRRREREDDTPPRTRLMNSVVSGHIGVARP